jgi:hypothetical protein
MSMTSIVYLCLACMCVANELYILVGVFLALSYVSL